jgi:CheY-like chemotaxis protein
MSMLAATGEAGIAAFLGDRPDCVLLDVRMPGIDGIAAAERIRAAPGGKDVPILFSAVRISSADGGAGVELASQTPGPEFPRRCASACSSASCRGMPHRAAGVGWGWRSAGSRSRRTAARSDRGCAAGCRVLHQAVFVRHGWRSITDGDSGVPHCKGRWP